MNVLFADEQDDPIVTDELLRLAELVLEEEGLESETGVSLVLVDEIEMTELNEAHMGKSGPTDVLSFPIEASTPGVPPMRSPGGPPIELGDVFIAPSVVRGNAERRGAAFDDELSLMVVHGLLHLLGWDHEVEDEAVRMEARESELLARVGRVRP
ncbi:MAG: rRNA maturation RNase YbeY [Actinomycetota bacterium]|nr:rRNA maturation RNase YbeY [Actinomycetota bacterium]